ncbi:MAG TPA: histidinol-phosphatase [Clostridiales bacterium]|nr:histidinol-phosphatase [Clostridiales bacterium]HCU56388.1 histidinol-phosphatase [Clostridiales bacterium]
MRDLHTHTQYSDGANTPEEMVQAALAIGLSEIGISDHSYTFFDESYCMKKESIPLYKEEIAALKEKYAGKISVLCGVEQDLFSQESTAGFDYAIGSLHYLKCNGAYYPIDCSKEGFEALCKSFFGGDYYALAEEYFSLMGSYAAREDILLIGHFDLISKYNEKGALFDETHPRYLAAAKKAADRLLAAGKTFEVNTGAIARGYRTQPYPANPIFTYLKEQGATFQLSSDAHKTKDIAFAFDRFSNS